MFRRLQNNYKTRNLEPGLEPQAHVRVRMYRYSGATLGLLPRRCLNHRLLQLLWMRRIISSYWYFWVTSCRRFWRVYRHFGESIVIFLRECFAQEMILNVLKVEDNEFHLYILILHFIFEGCFAEDNEFLLYVHDPSFCIRRVLRDSVGQ
jgi:hypothetical protein